MNGRSSSPAATRAADSVSGPRVARRHGRGSLTGKRTAVGPGAEARAGSGYGCRTGSRHEGTFDCAISWPSSAGWARGQ
ncbi:hypothetical protein GUJ93_ZPchr0014g46935 [Zizania palustris]|uniref:Uncharacterized protein n=1 Tax=Zizania palustris TaxID=103762 RepID=A0A8J5TEQ4_ZIZPA|nr:hypothetical protein GUJ93_ZPchr0014g46935 [Zizania palustris]